MGRPRANLLCAEPLCEETTRGGKPFCPSHTMHGAYAQQVRAGLDRDADQRAGRLELDADAPMLSEMAAVLVVRGTKSIGSLAHELTAAREVVMVALGMLCEHGDAVVGLRRGRPVAGPGSGPRCTEVRRGLEQRGKLAGFLPSLDDEPDAAAG